MPGMDTYDCVVVGGGPSGLSAAIYLARYNRSVIVADDGDGRSTTHEINENYLGFPDGIAATELRALGRRQVGGHRGHDVGGLLHRVRAPAAVGQVLGEDVLVVGLERVQRPADRELVVSAVVVTGGPALDGRHRSDPSSASPDGSLVNGVPPSCSRSRRMPASIRVFTVPSGAPVSAATSRCV